MNDLTGPLLRQLVNQAEARLRDDMHDSLEAMRAGLEQLVEAHTAELETRIDTVHRRALRAMTDALERRRPQ